MYRFLDESGTVIWGSKKLRDRENLEKWRSKILGKQDSIPNRGFWNDSAPLEADDPGMDEPKKIRVLVCGNTGAGKSTLINRIFGVSPSNEIVSNSGDFELIGANLKFRLRVLIEGEGSMIYGKNLFTKVVRVSSFMTLAGLKPVMNHRYAKSRNL